LNEPAQLGGRLRGIASTEHAGYVTANLDGHKNDSPRKTPPTQEKRKEYATKLTFGGTGAAADVRRAAPTGQRDQRPDAVDFVNIHRAKPVALGTVAMEDFFDLPVHHVGWELLPDAQDVSVLAATIVAEPLIVGALAAHDNRRTAVTAFSHGLPPGRVMVQVSRRVM